MLQARPVARRTVARRTAGAGATSPSGLALLVIATAQLMVLLDATMSTWRSRASSTRGVFGSAWNGWSTPTRAFGGRRCCGRAGDLLGRCKVFHRRASLRSRRLRWLAGSPPRGRGCSRRCAVQEPARRRSRPAALALIATTFPEGPPRNRAMGLYAAMSVAGGAVGLIAGGLLGAEDRPGLPAADRRDHGVLRRRPPSSSPASVPGRC